MVELLHPSDCVPDVVRRDSVWKDYTSRASSWNLVIDEKFKDLLWRYSLATTVWTISKIMDLEEQRLLK